MSFVDTLEYQSIYNKKKRNIIPIIADYLNYVLGIDADISYICELAECKYDENVSIDLKNKKIVKDYLSNILKKFNLGLKIFDTSIKNIGDTKHYSLQKNYIRIDASKFTSRYLYIAKYEKKYELITYIPEISFKCNLDVGKFKRDKKILHTNTSDEIKYNNPTEYDYEEYDYYESYNKVKYFSESLDEIIEENLIKYLKENNNKLQITVKELTDINNNNKTIICSLNNKIVEYEKNLTVQQNKIDMCEKILDDQQNKILLQDKDIKHYKDVNYVLQYK